LISIFLFFRVERDILKIENNAKCKKLVSFNHDAIRNRLNRNSIHEINLSFSSPPASTIVEIIYNFISRSCILNPVGLADTQKRVINCDNLQSSFRINLALDYQPRRGLTASSVDFHWAGNFVRESNQSAVDETHLSLHAESRDAFSDRPYAGKLDHRARKRMACNQCAFSNA